jgi:tetratricopeptide (TPR) repeat protein
MFNKLIALFRASSSQGAPSLTPEQKQALWMTPMELLASSMSAHVISIDSSSAKKIQVSKETAEWAKPIVDILTRASRQAEGGRFDEAIETFKLVLNAAPEAPIALMSIGCCYGAKRNKSEALKWLKRALKSDPHNSRIKGNIEAASEI